VTASACVTSLKEDMKEIVLFTSLLAVRACYFITVICGGTVCA